MEPNFLQKVNSKKCFLYLLAVSAKTKWVGADFLHSSDSCQASLFPSVSLLYICLLLIPGTVSFIDGGGKS